MLRRPSPTPPPCCSYAPPTPACAVRPQPGDSAALLCHSKRQILGKNRPLQLSDVRSTFTGFHIVFAAVVLALCASIGSAIAPPASTDKCADIKTEGYRIGFYLNGQTCSPTFKGTEVDLLKVYNDWAYQNKIPDFKPITARLLHGYDTSYALLYEAGEVLDMGNNFFVFNPHSNNKVKPHEWTRSEDELFAFPDVTIRVITDPAKVDPAKITFFDDVVFVGGKRINITRSLSEHKAIKAGKMDPQVTYKEGNHFDPAHWVSVEPGNSAKTLIGVVDGKKVLREECVLGENNLTFIKVMCSEFCSQLHIAGEPDSKRSYCFFIEDCPIATGPMGLFDTILVFPKYPIERPKIPPPTLAPTTTDIVVLTTTVNTTTELSTTQEAGFDYEAADKRQREINAAERKYSEGKERKLKLFVAFFIIDIIFF
ncbi:hypothetical protein L596_030172 [Steinernema carpocapsae]|uniref:Uncharacterized protein n=1 Tax=Steinernema carpocapsae TaxID=34508 RepID=A0A4U5LRX8_STECR|nr:hypothetical protein L596_030172 [Steinernema carpocapsae]